MTGTDRWYVSGALGVGTAFDETTDRQSASFSQWAGVGTGIRHTNKDVMNLLDDRPATVDQGPNLNWWGLNAAGNAARLGVIASRFSATAEGAVASYMSFFTKPDTGDVSEALRITSKGEVGIGTASPKAKLQVAGGGAIISGIALGATVPGLNYVYPYETIGVAEQNLNLRLQSPNSIICHTAGSPRLTIDTAGNVGIGTGTPNARLDLAGGSLRWGHSVANDDSIELGAADDRTEGVAPFIDFHFKGRAEDYNTRIINDADGQLSVKATTFVASGNAEVSHNFYVGDKIRCSAAAIVGQLEVGTLAGGRVQSNDKVVVVRGSTEMAFLDSSGTINGSLIIGTRVQSDDKVVVVRGSTEMAYLDSSGTINGSRLIATQKNFAIPHPTDPEHKVLVHAAIEGPELAVYYRGEGALECGQCTIELPEYFEALTRSAGRTVLVTPQFEDNKPIATLAASAVRRGAFKVHAVGDENSTQRFYWQVTAVRADVETLEAEVPKLELNRTR